MKTSSPRRTSLITTAVASTAAVVLAWTTESVSNDVGVANVGLMLALLCVGAALVDWFSGAITSLFAALSLNFFHTAPVHSLRINRGAEAATVLLLLALGALVSLASAVRLRRRTRVRLTAEQRAAEGRLRDLLDAGGPALLAWHAALDSVNPQLGLLDARLALTAPAGLALIGRHADDSGMVLLPEAGAAVPLGDHSGRVIVLRPQQGVGPLTVERRALLTFADHLAESLDAVA